MSTPADTPVLTQLHPISAFIKTHERLVLLAIAGLVLWFGIGKIDTLIQNHDNANLQQAKVTAQSQADKTAEIAEQVQVQAAQYQALASKLDAQNQALVQANVQATLALAQRQKTDATLPPTELVARWNALVPSANVAVSTNGETLPSSGAVATVQQLELVPVLSTQLENERTQLGNAQALLVAEGGQVTTLNTEVSSLNMQLKDNQNVCNQSLKVQKDAYEKKLRHRTLWAFVAGFVSRQLLTKGI